MISRGAEGSRGTDRARPPDRNEIHLWYTDPEALTDPDILRGFRDILSPDERRRHGRFAFEADRHLFLVAHALLRCSLSKYSDVPPAGWIFEKGEHGKPAVAASENLPLLRFNLSHTAGLAACAVASDTEVGVDVEDTTRAVDLELADRYFSAEEVAGLEQAPLERRRDVFYDLWTLKEAYLKARGVGLSLPLADFTLHLDEGQSPRISFAAGLADDPSRWRFFRHRPGLRHRIAVAARCLPGANPVLIPRETEPRAPSP